MRFLALIFSANLAISGLFPPAPESSFSLTFPMPPLPLSNTNPYELGATLNSNRVQKKKKKEKSETTAIVDKSDDTAKKDNTLTGSRLTAAEAEKLLTLHNKVRADVGVAPVTWSSELAMYAQEWADHLAGNTCNLEHRPGSGRWGQKYGENLFIGSSRHFEAASAVKYWEEEKRAYNGQAIDSNNQSKSGHYTQIVWQRTRQIGCAKVECKNNIIVVCNYDPPGNMLGQKPY